MSSTVGKRRALPALALLPPQYVEPPPGQPELLAAALRTLFRNHLEERLAESGESSVDDTAVDGEES